MRRQAVVLCLIYVLALSHPAVASTGEGRLDNPAEPKTAKVENPGVRVASASSRFNVWIRSFRRKAVAKGISGSVYDKAFQGVKYNAYVVDKDRNQSEFTKQIWDYLDTATSATRVRNGKTAWTQRRNLLKRIEKKIWRGRADRAGHLGIGKRLWQSDG